MFYRLKGVVEMEENKYGIYGSIVYRGDLKELQDFIKQTDGCRLTKEQDEKLTQLIGEINAEDITFIIKEKE
jgi:inner membrane protein involved in colicin E2 resistance